MANGLALCTVHHKLFDRGVLGAAADGEILVSADFAAMSEADDLDVTRLIGRGLRSPQSNDQTPGVEHLTWHRTQVFAGEPRSRD